MDVGTVCIKTAGKDAGKKVVVVDSMEGNFVLIDGPIKRKRCNIAHLEPTLHKFDLKKNASHAEVVKEFKKLKIDIKETKPKTKKAPKPVRQIKKKEAVKEVKKETKKEVPKEKTTKKAKK
jgi:large subunit ribosomal protein L14e